MEPSHAIGEPLGVLCDPILEHLRTVPHGPQVAVYAPDHCFPAVTKLAGHREGRDRRAIVETLEPRAAVGMPEHLGSDLAGLPAGAYRDGIQERPRVHEHGLASRGREQ